MADTRLGVLLLNMGGPDSLESVPAFLRNIFRDPQILPLPLGFLTRPLLARWIVAARTAKVQEQYAQIGGKSPLAALSHSQATALHSVLHRRGIEAAVEVAMRYWHPYTEEALARLEAAGALEQLVVLPLYPHYSRATTGSSVAELKRCLKGRKPALDYHLIESYYNHPLYLDALTERIEEGLRGFAEPERSGVQLLFSAHGLPESYVRGGDPYQRQIEATVMALKQRFPRQVAKLAYQSKVGPAKWLGPSMDETIRKLGAEKVMDVLVIPISFVSDYIETLYEIDILYARLAKEAGIENFRRVRSLNGSIKFIECLAELVISGT